MPGMVNAAGAAFRPPSTRLKLSLAEGLAFLIDAAGIEYNNVDAGNTLFSATRTREPVSGEACRRDLRVKNAIGSR
jgi:hypothetical protein